MLSPQQEVLRRLSENTWDSLRDSNRTGLPRSETTLTENFFDSLSKEFPGKVDLTIFNPVIEGRNGADWLWSFRNPSGRPYMAMLVQAKRLDRSESKYIELTHTVGKTAPRRQIDLLLASSRRLKVPALYAFYNSTRNHHAFGFRCPRPEPEPEPKEWGIALAHAGTVKRCLDANALPDRSFSTHSANSYPLHCLFCTCAGTRGMASPTAQMAKDFFHMPFYWFDDEYGPIFRDETFEPSSKLAEIFDIAEKLRPQDLSEKERRQLTSKLNAEFPNLAGSLDLTERPD
ncbi:MAG: DUF6615 family protein [Asticcacaulis sp.]|uniref:DUF6615 family protein n=1 Tax=Asticcacaulis sp. TaxID=1872648 RepID=UPI003F7C1A6C